MKDACTIDRETPGSFNESTGDYGTSTWSTLYAGACQLTGPYPSAATNSTVDVAEKRQSIQQQSLVLPHGSGSSVEVGDRVRITGYSDTYYVIGQIDATTMTARALVIQKVESGS